jgi:hypothetical protein
VSDLPTRLSQGDHPVTYRARGGDARTELREVIDRQYVHVLFTGTQGGTELGFRPDPARSDVSSASWETGEGVVHLEGELNIDGVQVRCVADIDLATVEGTGRLEILQESAAA